MPRKLSRRHNKPNSTRAYNESIVALQNTAAQLATNPNSSNAYHLRLYPLTLERSALLSQLVVEENNAHDAVQTAYEEERSRVEDEYKRGRDKVRERLLEGIEERRRRAREEKDGEGISGTLTLREPRCTSFRHPLTLAVLQPDATLEAQSRSHITRKLRNKLGGSPPPSSYGGYASGATTSNGAALPATVVPVPNPNSLSVDELPSPFPLPLTASAPSGGYNNGGQKRRNKGGGVQPMALTGLGKAISQLTACKELEVDSDLFEIRRSAKRKRAAAANAGIKT